MKIHKNTVDAILTSVNWKAGTMSNRKARKLWIAKETMTAAKKQANLIRDGGCCYRPRCIVDNRTTPMTRRVFV
jgi:hypothetical protein